jgi:hypothetical protein
MTCALGYLSSLKRLHVFSVEFIERDPLGKVKAVETIESRHLKHEALNMLFQLTLLNRREELVSA